MAIDLSQFVKTGHRIMPPKIVVTGVGGIGKTTFAAGDKSLGLVGPPDPIFAFTEEGQGRLDLARFELRQGDPVLRSWDEIMSTVEYLYTAKHEHKTFVLDTLDGAEPLIWDGLCKRYNEPKIDTNDRGSNFAYGRGYLYSADEIQLLLDGLDALRRDRGMAIILLAHADTVKVEPPDSEAYTQYTMKVQKRIAAAVHDWCDAWFFATWKRHVVKDVDARDKKKQRARGVGVGERIMYTEERPAWIAKNRYSLPAEMPFNWQTFIDSMVPPGVTPPEPVAPEESEESDADQPETQNANA